MVEGIDSAEEGRRESKLTREIEEVEREVARRVKRIEVLEKELHALEAARTLSWSGSALSRGSALHIALTGRFRGVAHERWQKKQQARVLAREELRKAQERARLLRAELDVLRKGRAQD